MAPELTQRPSARLGLARPVVGSGMEQVPADRGDVGEDPDAEHDDDAGGQLTADAELVAEVDDEGAMSTLLTNETTKTLSSKIPSRKARSAPNTASSAATTAMGR